MAFNFEEMQNAQENGGNFPRPQAGGHIMKVVSAEDVPSKQYYKLTLDYAFGELKDYGANTEARTGWTTGYSTLFASYKPKALGFMKHRCKLFTEANKGRFSSERAARDAKEFIGKGIGVILQEEEYEKKDGTIGTRLVIKELCLPDDIRNGNFTVPEKKLLDKKPSAAPAPSVSEEDEELPF